MLLLARPLGLVELRGSPVAVPVAVEPVVPTAEPAVEPAVPDALTVGSLAGDDPGFHVALPVTVTLWPTWVSRSLPPWSTQVVADMLLPDVPLGSAVVVLPAVVAVDPVVAAPAVVVLADPAGSTRALVSM